jgi:hypothetical protein
MPSGIWPRRRIQKIPVRAAMARAKKNSIRRWREEKGIMIDRDYTPEIRFEEYFDRRVPSKQEWHKTLALLHVRLIRRAEKTNTLGFVCQSRCKEE